MLVQFPKPMEYRPLSSTDARLSASGGATPQNITQVPTFVKKNL